MYFDFRVRGLGLLRPLVFTTSGHVLARWLHCRSTAMGIFILQRSYTLQENSGGVYKSDS